MARLCPQEVVVCHTWLILDGLREKRVGQGGFVLREGISAFENPRLGIACIEHEQGVNVAESSSGVFERQVSLCSQQIATGKGWPLMDEGFRLCQGGRMVFQLHVAKRTIVAHPLIVRLFEKGMGVVLHRLAELLIVDATKAAQLIKLIFERIAIDGFVQITLGTAIVFQGKLGHGSKIVGIGRGGTGFQHAVEIVERGDIVVVIQGTPPHHHILNIRLRSTCQSK